MDGFDLAFGGVHEELDTQLNVEGDLPAWLNGTLIRNGPGRFEFGDTSVDHWFDGLAMLRAFRFQDGTARYRNRFLRTEAYAAAEQGDYGGGFGTPDDAGLVDLALAYLTPPDATDNTNVNVWRLGGEFAAMTETPKLTTFDGDTLETTGRTSYLGEPSGQLTTAHPHHDRARGETVNLVTAFGRTSEYRITRQPDGVWNRELVGAVETDKPAYLHDFGVTDKYVVITEVPLVVEPWKLLVPSTTAFIDRYDWKPERGTRIALLNRETGELVADPVTEAFFCFHHVNAFDRPDGTLTVDLVTFPDPEPITGLYFDSLDIPGTWEIPGGRLDRLHIDPDAGTVNRERLHPGGVGLPRISREARRTPHRYVYAQGTRGQPVTDLPTELLKIDVDGGAHRRHHRAGCYFSEPVFIPRPNGSGEDDGVVLAVILDTERQQSCLLILDGETFTERARARLPHALPLDFHGQWFPADDPDDF